jgi:hypothetical protein
VIVALNVEVEPFGYDLFNFADSVEVWGVVVSFVEIIFTGKFIVQDDFEVWFFVQGLFILFEIRRTIWHNCIIDRDFGFMWIRVIQILSFDIEHGQWNFNGVLDAHRYYWLHVWTPVFWTKTDGVVFILWIQTVQGWCFWQYIELILGLKRWPYIRNIIAFKNQGFSTGYIVMLEVYQFDLYNFLNTIITIRIWIAALYPASLHFDVVAISFLQLKAKISDCVAPHFFNVIFNIPVQRQELRKYFVNI